MEKLKQKVEVKVEKRRERYRQEGTIQIVVLGIWKTLISKGHSEM